MNAHDEERIKQLLKQALPPVEGSPEPARDLWPAMLQRLNARPDTRPAARPAAAVPWFDWALAGGVVAFVVFFPASIPMLLYYL